MKLFLKILLPVLVLCACVVTARAFIANKPEASKRPQFKTVTAIDATRVEKTDYPVIVRTQGSVGTARDGSLVPQVTGTITGVSPNYVSGGFFRSGETLLEVDRRDYEIALTMTQATLAQAEATLAEEKARSEQAALDWRRLGRKGKPSALTLRRPQLAAAKAGRDSAAAQVQRAELDLERTAIIAPYDGRIASISADLGQFINKGAALATIYSVDRAEVRLPLSNRQLGYVELPSIGGVLNAGTVTLSANIGGQQHQWRGEIVRTEGTIDPNSRQLYAVASVEAPYSTSGERPPLRVGQYVQAELAGKILKDVIVIPRAALREDREVLVVDELNTLQRREVEVQWKDGEIAVIGAGLEAGEIISLTTLGTVVNGTRVRATVDGQPPQAEPPPRPGASAVGGGGARERLQRLKAMIDAGEDIPAAARERIQARIAAGQPVPEWLREHVQKSTVAQ